MELLQWHHRLGHFGLEKIQFLMRTRVLANTEATKSLHTFACKFTTYPFVQHVSLANRDKGHLQEKKLSGQGCSRQLEEAVGLHNRTALLQPHYHLNNNKDNPEMHLS